jgi:hypothetical protein
VPPSRRGQRAAALALAAGSPAALAPNIVAATRTAWANASFGRTEAPKVTSACVGGSTGHKYGLGSYVPSFTSKFSGGLERFAAPKSAQLKKYYSSSAQHLNQEMWLNKKYSVHGKDTSWAEAGWLLGNLHYGSSISPANVGLFYARQNKSGYAVWWFPTMPRTIKRSSYWVIKAVQHSTTKSRYDLYAYQYSHGGHVQHSSTNYVRHFSNDPVLNAQIGIETTCWNKSTFLYGTEPLGGNGQSFSYKQGGTYYQPTPSRGFSPGPGQLTIAIEYTLIRF